MPTIPDRYISTGQKLNGGQGVVYVCTDKNLERKVAIKFIKDVADLPRLLNEVAMLQTLRSKHVVEIYDLIFDAKTNEVGIVQEFLPGDDLFEAWKKHAKAGKLDIGPLYNVLYQMACGLADIHTAGVIHRDIKLNNIKYDAEKVLNIFDFGLAKNVGPAAKTIGFKGTPIFAAPEMYAQEVRIDQPMDVYAFGVCGWFLACGDLPLPLKQMPPQPAGQSIKGMRPDLADDVVDLLDRAVGPAAQRPVMKGICGVLARRLLHDKHRGILCARGNRYTITAKQRSIKIEIQGLGTATISYDGLDFRIQVSSGNVFINNIQVTEPQILPGASVLTFGQPEAGPRRRFVTFDISHPEVII